MSWRDELRPASWRGIEFLVDGSSVNAGRRTVVHKYPLRDRPYVEDLGSQVRRWAFDAFLVGEDFHLELVRLQDALNQPGAGRLVHPLLGAVDAVLDGEVRLQLSTAQGGLARFSLEFVESSATPASFVSVATGAAVQVAVSAATEAAVERFATTELAGAARPAARSRLDDVLSAMRGAQRGIASSAALSNSIERELAAFERGLDALLNSPATLASAVMGLAGRLMSLAAGLERDETESPRTVAAAAAVARVLRSMRTSPPPVPDYAPDTATRRAEASAAAEVDALSTTAVVVAACAVAAEIAFESADQANRLRDDLETRLSDLTEDQRCTDTAYGALQDLRAAVVDHLIRTAAELPRIAYFTPTTCAPALVLAQRIYGDARREAEVLARNAIRHPLFVPALVPLEVLDG